MQSRQKLIGNQHVVFILREFKIENSKDVLLEIWKCFQITIQKGFSFRNISKFEMPTLVQCFLDCLGAVPGAFVSAIEVWRKRCPLRVCHPQHIHHSEKDNFDKTLGSD